VIADVPYGYNWKKTVAPSSESDEVEDDEGADLDPTDQATEADNANPFYWDAEFTVGLFTYIMLCNCILICRENDSDSDVFVKTDNRFSHSVYLL
jgi:hypothetical protein